METVVLTWPPISRDWLGAMAAKELALLGAKTMDGPRVFPWVSTMDWPPAAFPSDRRVWGAPAPAVVTFACVRTICWPDVVVNCPHIQHSRSTIRRQLCRQKIYKTFQGKKNLALEYLGPIRALTSQI